MKALTIYQPWASLIMVGAKPYEFRSNSYLNPRSYRIHPIPGERIVIHAGARKMVVREIADILNKLALPAGEDHTGLIREPAHRMLRRLWDQPRDGFQMLPLGAGLGTAVIGQPCNAAELINDDFVLPHDSDRGDFNWAWPLSDIQAFDAPIPARGMQGLWEWKQ